MARTPESPEGVPLPPRGLPLALRRFLRTEAAGGLVLLVSALAALAWANSPWDASYDRLWHTAVNIRVGTVGFTDDLRHFVNEALMTLFFFVVGLEIKRELVTGELRSWRTAALPVIAAAGGMVVPAALYLVLNAGGPGARGWAIPMATDIAFAVGVLAVLGDRVPSSLKLFLLTLAVADDVGAIVVIAVFYSGEVRLLPLAGAAALIVLMAALRRARVVWMPLHTVIGIGVWLATYESGIHATLAGATLGLLAPARPLGPVAVAREWASDLSDEPAPADLRVMTRLANSAMSVAERLEQALHPVSSFVVLPIFALANAGVALDGSGLRLAGGTAVAGGVVLGLVVGKTVGITAASALAVRLRIGQLPEGVQWSQIAGVAAVAGVGFTVSIFVAGLAFPDARLEAAAKLGITIASALAGMVGAALLAAVHRPAAEAPG
jgi:NhaA family Na+:H+ antiporter